MQKTDQKQSRTAYLDLIRFVAIAAVILLHVVSGTRSQYTDQMTGLQNTVYTAIERCCAIGVPLFLMISGALFLDENKKIPLRVLFGKYIRRLVLALLLFGWAYSLMEIVFNARTVEPVFALQAFFGVLKGDTWSHLWYLYMIIGLYLFMPLWQAMAKSLTREQYRYVLVLLFVVGCVLPPFLNMGWRIGLEFPFNNIYVFFFLAGHYVHKYLKEDVRLKGAAVVLTVLLPILTFADSLAGTGLTEGYNGIPATLAALSIFYLAGKCRQIPSWCTAWRTLAFGVYLIHPFFLNLLYKGLHLTPLMLGGYVLIPIFWIAAGALSVLAVVILRKIPVLRKYVL